MNLVKTSRETLLKPLQSVSGIIERRHTLPILSNVLLTRHGQSLTYLATDVEIEITSSINIDAAGEDKAVTVGARKLLDILRALPEGAEVTLSVLDKRLQVKSGKSRFNLQTLPPEDFPRMPAAEATAVRFKVEQRVLKSLFAQVQYAMAQQDIRYYLNGLLMVVDGATLRMVATDGHRLALATKTLEEGTELGKLDVILPRKTILELSRLLADNDTPVEIELTANQARFSFGDTVLVAKLIDGKFPDYNKVIPKNHPKQLDISRAQLQQALQRVAILTNDKFRGVRWVLSDGCLRISCSNTEQEEAQEEIDVEYSGEALDVGFNVTYLLDIVNNVSAESVHCALGDVNSSVVFTVKDHDDFKYVVMPMRI